MAVRFFSAASPQLPQSLLRHPLSSPRTRPPADDLASSWILEFVLRQPIPDWLVHEIFLALPFSSCFFHPHLRKAILLFRLTSELRQLTFSEQTLSSLELIEDLDRLRGSTPSDRMKAAYCAVAVECTASALRRSAVDFADTVGRIWMCRIADLAQSEAAVGLVSDELIEWANKIERWLPSGAGGEALLYKDIKEAIQLLSAYLDEAIEDMGPPVLEIAAMEVLDNTTNVGGAAEKVGDAFTVCYNSLGKLDERDKGLQEDVVGLQRECLHGVFPGVPNYDGIREISGALEDVSGKELESSGIRDESGRLRNASAKQGCDTGLVVELDVNSGELKGQALDGGQAMPDHVGVINNLAPDEVLKVKEALKKSYLELRMAVEDPLPQVQAFAAAVLASTQRSSMANGGLPVSSVELVAGETVGVDAGKVHLEGSHVTKECSKDAEPSNHENVAHHSIFDRNPTAHMSEWSDETLSSLEKSPAHVEKLCKPKRRTAIPHLINGKLIKRRPVKKWSSLEESTLREAVAKYGKGNWKLILSRFAEVFEERTEVDLKDKWRFMSRNIC
ncbi:hypothetical protein HPP92_009505 [Vanilla planifolia]|uniref:Uncharacterized protein n=1 Tax=Vanilla planifolia TaxID=51239 RepID=A0A835V711_VANPL|nr:hypothetical protein HPP92_009505 [Vanilla planifolia]